MNLHLLKFAKEYGSNPGVFFIMPFITDTKTPFQNAKTQSPTSTVQLSLCPCPTQLPQVFRVSLVGLQMYLAGRQHLSPRQLS